MKKLLILAIAAVGLLACNGKNEPENSGNSDNSKNPSTSATITCAPTSKTVDAAGGEFTVTITSNAAWMTTVDKSWVTVAPNSGQGDAFVTITVKGGRDKDEARIMFSSGKNSVTVTIYREALIDRGMLPGKFSVSSSYYVRFSQGNLQYQASTQTWRFAEMQYDIVGDGNRNISSSYSGWIDLFGWGTGENPTLSTTKSDDYNQSNDWGRNLPQRFDLGVTTWTTMTDYQWKYLFETRSNASGKYGMASVSSVNGIIILPDIYDGPAINTSHSAWNNNTISASDWNLYEAYGAVFLPAAGYRDGTYVGKVGSYGYYWSSSNYYSGQVYDYKYASNIKFNWAGLSPQDYSNRSIGGSVRLVHEYSK